jgi:hypothetical protein
MACFEESHSHSRRRHLGQKKVDGLGGDLKEEP